MEAKIPCTEGPTNTPGSGTPARLDYFIVRADLKDAIKGVRMIKEFAWEEEGEKRAMAANTHALLALEIQSNAVQRYMDTIRAPRKFERYKPVGCPRAPIVPCGWEGTEGGRASAMPQGRIDEAWRDMVRCAEAELCGLFDSIKNGGPNAKWCGRGGMPEIVKRYCLPGRAGKGRGHMRQAHYSAIWALNRVGELLALIGR